MAIFEMVTVVCIECEEAMEFDSELMLGEIITCSECESVMEVIRLNPVELDFYWDDEDDDEDDW